MTTIAEQLKTAGYSTHAVGKWNVGMCSSRQTPKGRGFDSSLIYFDAANDYYSLYSGFCREGLNFTYVQDFWTHDDAKGIPEGPASSLANPRDCVFNLTETPFPPNRPDCKYEDELFADFVYRTIEEHDPDTPFFLYYTPHIAHEPLMVPERFYNKFAHIEDESRRRYLAMVNYQDEIVGNITSLLKAKGMWDDLLWLGSSDNGGPIYDSIMGDLPHNFPDGTVAYAGASNYPLRGGKVSNFEGGIRVNSWAAGGLVPASKRGTVLDDLVSSFDWYMTACSLAGLSCDDQRAAAAGLPKIDSLDLWPYISGQQEHSPRTEFYAGDLQGLFQGKAIVQAAIVANYEEGSLLKIITQESRMDVYQGPVYPNASTVVDPTKSRSNCGLGGCLYDLRADPGEHVNLADQRPQDLKDLQLLVTAADLTVYNPDRGDGNEDIACPLALGKYGGFWGPYLDEE